MNTQQPTLKVIHEETNEIAEPDDAGVTGYRRAGGEIEGEWRL